MVNTFLKTHMTRNDFRFNIRTKGKRSPPFTDEVKTRNETNFPADILFLLSSGVSEALRRSLDHARKARCIDSGLKILGHH